MTTEWKPTDYPLSLMASNNCCDAHVECDAEPPGAVHSFMNAEARKANHAEAVRRLSMRFPNNPL